MDFNFVTARTSNLHDGIPPHLQPLLNKRRTALTVSETFQRRKQALVMSPPKRKVRDFSADVLDVTPCTRRGRAQ